MSIPDPLIRTGESDDADYALAPGWQNVWITVGNRVIYIHLTDDERISVEILPANDCMAPPYASCRHPEVE